MIGIICALDIEVQAMLLQMEKVEAKKLYQMDIYTGRIFDHEVIVANSGVGKVNAAISATLLLSHYHIEMILNVGVAGGLLENQHPLDVVIAKNVIQHDFDTSAVDKEQGLGITISCDEMLAKQFQQCVANQNITSWIGDIASGDSFVTIDHYFDRIRSLFPSCVCAEMEAGAIAQCANAFQTPCLIIRTLSDVAVKENSAMDFVSFAKKASAAAAQISADFINKLK